MAKAPASLVSARKAFQAGIEETSPGFTAYAGPSIDHEFDGFGTELVVADGHATLTLYDVAPGSPGVAGYGPGRAGLANNFDTKLTYQPYAARGLNNNFGLYHQAYLDSAAYQRGVSKIVEGLTTGYWSIEPVTCEDAVTQELADRQAQAVDVVLFGLEGGWSKHVREVVYGLLVPGFAPFVRVVDGFGQLKQLSFRYPSQVNRWYTTENQADLIGVEFNNVASDGTGPRITVAADDLLLYQYNAVGNNFEGISPLRGVFKFCKMAELFVQIEACAAEKYGCPVTYVERPEGKYDATDDARVVDMLDAFVATDNATLLLPGGYKVTVASPVGTVPDFEPIRRYLDEQIALALTAEGSLVGMNGVGSYNLAEMKDGQALRTLSYYAKLLAEVINGTNVPYTGIIDHIISKLSDASIHEHFCGRLPRLVWSLSPEQDDATVDQIVAAKNAGLLSWGEEDEALLRRRLKLPARVALTAAVAQQQGGQ